MKQKVVIKVCINDQKSRSKAMKIAVSVSGVESAGLQEDKNKIEVKGDGIDVVVLTKLLRKSLGFADLESVGPIEEQKKETPPKKEAEPAVNPPVWSPPYVHYGNGGPYIQMYEVISPNHDPYCCIL